MSKVRRFLKPLVATALVLSAAYFFYGAFQRNWDSIRAHEFQLRPGYLLMATAGALATSLLGTFRSCNPR